MAIISNSPLGSTGRTDTPQQLSSDIQRLNPGSLVDLFELDTSTLGGEVFRWHNGVNGLGSDVVWQGNTYNRLPVEASGFERSSKGTMARPSLRVANVSGLVGALVRELDDLVGAKVIRRRTFVKYLDAINFPNNFNSAADPNVSFPDEVWSIDRKASENGVFVEFELSSAFDVQGIQLPRRQCIQNVCVWKYRGAECGFTGGTIADSLDQYTNNPALDQCGKRLASCKLRFGANSELPYGSFPGTGLIR